MTPKGMNTWKSNSLSHINVPAWRGALCKWRAIIQYLSFNTECEHPRSLCAWSLHSKVSEISLTDWLFMSGWLSSSSYLSHLLEATTFLELGPVTVSCHLHLQYVSQSVCCWCCDFEARGGGEIQLMAWSAVFIQFVQLSSSWCHHVCLPPLICRL